jgi:glycosyltransferase involved in cell wall biosynthesis
MKIIYFGNMNDIHSLKWSDYFKQHGHSVSNVHADGFSLNTVRGLKRAIRDFKPDILHAQYMGAWGLMGALTGFHPFIGTIHGSEVLLTKGPKKWLVQWVLNKADLITTDGHHIEHKLKTEWGIPERKIRHINFGVDVEKFKPVPVIKDYNVCYRTGPDSLYGEETIQRALGLINEIHVAPLVYYRPDRMPEILNRSEIYVSAALSDAGLSSTTSEAMACGLPVVVTNVADNQTWIDPSFTFEPGDYKHIASLIMELLSDPDLRASQGAMNRDIIVKSNNYNVEMAKMEKIYKEACNE